LLLTQLLANFGDDCVLCFSAELVYNDVVD